MTWEGPDRHWYATLFLLIRSTKLGRDDERRPDGLEPHKEFVMKKSTILSLAPCQTNADFRIVLESVAGETRVLSPVALGQRKRGSKIEVVPIVCGPDAQLSFADEVEGWTYVGIGPTREVLSVVVGNDPLVEQLQAIAAELNAISFFVRRADQRASDGLLRRLGRRLLGRVTAIRQKVAVFVGFPRTMVAEFQKEG